MNRSKPLYGHRYRRRSSFNRNVLVSLVGFCCLVIPSALFATMELSERKEIAKIASSPRKAPKKKHRHRQATERNGPREQQSGHKVRVSKPQGKPRRVTKIAKHDEHQEKRPGQEPLPSNPSKQHVGQKVPPTSRQTRTSKNHGKDKERGGKGRLGQGKGKLDFIVAGFPKCGTTSLLYALKDHEETAIAQAERCGVAELIPDNRALEKLDEAIAELSAPPGIKRGIKCPMAVERYQPIARLEQHSPSAKFIVGLRHPIEFLQSFYNYRVTELHDKHSTEPIPSLLSVIYSGEPWKGISLDAVRFDLYLMQFGKTQMEKEALREFAGRKEMAIKPSSAKIFIYTLEQLEDTDPTRSAAFRRSFQSFLGLRQPFKPFTRENKNHFVGEKSYPETIDICEAKYQKVRKELVQQGRSMAYWMHQFIQSSEVTVSNRDHFLRSIDSWGADPCEKGPLPSQNSVKVLVRRKKN